MDLAKVVSTTTRQRWHTGTHDLDSNMSRRTAVRFHIVAYDFGIKRNILRMLADRGCDITLVPAQTPASEVFALQPDGVFLSNGPGDPEPCDYAIAAIREFLRARVPTFGICLGHQLLGLAAGARTIKMKFGHHGANHPVIDLASGRVMISSRPCRRTCVRRIARCSMIRCRASNGSMRPHSVSRATRKPAPVRTTWLRCSTVSSD
jgi:carbamoyl-phosphate synthase small subunit